MTKSLSVSLPMSPSLKRRSWDGELALGVLEGDLGLRDARPDVGEGLGLGHVGLDLGEDVAGFTTAPSRTFRDDDAARKRPI